jgi:hypothetical protein
MATEISRPAAPLQVHRSLAGLLARLPPAAAQSLSDALAVLQVRWGAVWSIANPNPNPNPNP